MTDWLELPAHLGITATLGPCPAELRGARRITPYLQVAPGRVLVRFPTWALLVEDGCRATVEWPSAGEGGPAWIVDSWAVSLAMLQRGRVSLHGSLVRVGDRVVAIAGESGAGKSTTSMGLRARGHDLLTDDIAIIDLREGAAWVVPYHRQVHLLPDAAVALGIDFAALPGLAGFPDKSAFAPEDHDAGPQPLDVIVILATVPETCTPGIRELNGRDRLTAVLQHAGRQVTAPAVMGEQQYFETLAELCRTTRVLMVERSTERWSLEEVLELIELGVSAPTR